MEAILDAVKSGRSERLAKLEAKKSQWKLLVDQEVFGISSTHFACVRVHLMKGEHLKRITIVEMECCKAILEVAMLSPGSLPFVHLTRAVDVSTQKSLQIISSLQLLFDSEHRGFLSCQVAHFLFTLSQASVLPSPILLFNS